MPRNGRYKPALTGREKAARHYSRHGSRHYRYYKPTGNEPGRPPVWVVYRNDAGNVVPCRWWEVPAGVVAGWPDLPAMTMPRHAARLIADWLNQPTPRGKIV
jgi:hypothetical protein